ncbi:MAG: NAD-dependent succinate-semialdehyde dehydrogenase [Acidimicrobiales bacterium]
MDERDEREAAVIAAVPTGAWIGGREVDVDRTFPVHDPATGEVLTEVADAGPAEGDRALAVAADTQAAWAATPPRERGEVLRRAFELLGERLDDLALLMTLEMGKPLAESRAEISYAAEFLRWFSEEAVRIDGGYLRNPAGPGRLVVLRQPVGPCLLITPWNFPMAMGTRKLGPALAAGCTAIVKPAALTPLSMLALARVLADAGLPDGVLSVVPTSDAAALTEPLFADDRLRKLSFTGSTEVGRVLLRQAADQILKVSLELGGNAPLIVFDDADLDVAVEQTLVAKMRNIGEACTAANRILVHADVADPFTKALADRMSGLTIGRRTDPDVQVGPLIEEKARSKVADLVADAVGKGGEVVAGGRSIGGPGWFYEPTVLGGIPADAELNRVEIFGPVAAIRTFTSEAEALALANDTEYGLTGYLFTRDLARALRVAEAMEVGMVGLNQGLVSNPAGSFGGIKQSGIGREGGFTGIDEYLERKLLFVAEP